MIHYGIEQFAPPLKQELPLLQYDIALYCNQFLKETCCVWPDYLNTLRDKVMSYATQLVTLKSRLRDVSPDIRIYILDHRLNLLFTALDSTGTIASYMSKFCAQYKKYESEQYYYGDGLNGESPLKPDLFELNGEEFYTPDPKELYSFNQQYGFVPSELFAVPAVLLFQGDSLKEIRRTTTEHCVLLMEKFHSKNLVDLKAILKGVDLFEPFTF